MDALGHTASFQRQPGQGLLFPKEGQSQGTPGGLSPLKAQPTQPVSSESELVSRRIGNRKSPHSRGSEIKACKHVTTLRLLCTHTCASQPGVRSRWSSCCLVWLSLWVPFGGEGGVKSLPNKEAIQERGGEKQSSQRLSGRVSHNTCRPGQPERLDSEGF